ncbi:YggS family pyridoxal phosphate-dependent enzyme [Jeotgalibacillus soli]|uniref:Pyridoxal phosphate homeostasis protein n=1 Tax=Jeotgalibacillus soli TaxID=889306 RepID=A0A0C2VLC8_9BACL|nr:YggS family pyridoxal phosphate-dependent enzyme [Jeotgalibacillus soli]KIL44808.1 hypothetical protein KP78_23520 [Jeotgalibacillus soli]
MRVEEKWQAVKKQIEQASLKSNHPVTDVTVIAVTKYVTNERAQEAIDAGIIHLGENRPEGLLEKQQSIIGQAVWHYIGTMQTRKVKDVIDHVDYLHSLDRISLAKEIQKRAASPVNCFVQVNVSGEESKQGLFQENAISFIKEIAGYDKVRVVGLMTMAPNTKDQKVLRQCFKNLKALQVEIQNQHFEHAPCTELSMGMSNDFEIAIEEGATFIRVGTALVGE